MKTAKKVTKKPADKNQSAGLTNCLSENTRLRKNELREIELFFLEDSLINYDSPVVVNYNWR